MNTERKEMIYFLNEIVVPVLKEKGFQGSFPHFRRIGKDRINLLTFQFDRHGGGFVIEIANCITEGYKTYTSKLIQPTKLTAHDFYKRKRIQSNMNTDSSDTDDWFRYDRKKFFSIGNVYKKISKEVLSKLPLADEYWTNGPLS